MEVIKESPLPDRVVLPSRAFTDTGGKPTVRTTAYYVIVANSLMLG